MGRRRIRKRETNAQDVLPIHVSKLDFEQQTKTIIDYTKAIRSHNRDTNQRELSKVEVTQQFTLAVLSEYATTETRCFELLGQAESPAYYKYWAKLADQETAPRNRQQVDDTSFWMTKRKLPPALVKRYSDCVTLENEDLGLVIVPSIALRSIHQISYKETLRSIFDANKEIDSLHVYARQLWVAIISIVYHFEDAALRESKLKEMSTSDVEVDKLVESYRLSHQNTSTHGMDSPQDQGKKRHLEDEPAPAQEKKGKGHMKEEDYGEDDVDAEAQARSRKRLKLKRGTWQEFGKELESAGATMTPFPISLDLPDTNLPFRPKK